MTEPSVPSLESLRDSLAKFDAAVDAQDTLGGAVWASVCTGQLQTIVDALQSGAYALISREDREKAIVKARAAESASRSAMLASYHGDRYAEDQADHRQAQYLIEARSLLSLDAPKETTK